MWPFRRRTDETRAALTLAGARDIEDLTTPYTWVPPRRGVAEILRAGREQPWYHAALNRIADAFTAVQWEVTAPPAGMRNAREVARSIQWGVADPEARAQATKEWPRIINHAALDLLRAGSPMIRGRASLRLAVKYYCSAGEAFFVIARDSRGVPSQLWIMPPHWVRGTPSQFDPAFHIQHHSTDRRFAKQDVIWIKSHDLEEPYERGSGTGYSLGDELDQDEYAARFAKAFFYNDASPRIIGSFEDMEDHELREARRELDGGHRGYKKAHRPFFTNRKAQITVVQHDLEKIGLVKQRQFLRDTVVQVHGVPPEILGILTSSNRATISAADHIMSKYVTVPICEAFCEALQYGLADVLGSAVLGYVSPIPEDKEFKLKVAQIFPQAVTIREVRELGGFTDRGESDNVPAGAAQGEADDTDPNAPNAAVSGTGAGETVDP